MMQWPFAVRRVPRLELLHSFPPPTFSLHSNPPATFLFHLQFPFVLLLITRAIMADDTSVPAPPENTTTELPPQSTDKAPETESATDKPGKMIDLAVLLSCLCCSHYILLSPFFSYSYLRLRKLDELIPLCDHHC